MSHDAHRQAALNTNLPRDVRLSHLGILQDLIAAKHKVKPAGVSYEVLLATDLHIEAPSDDTAIARIVASLQTLNDHWLDLPAADRKRQIIFVMDPDDTPSQDFREIWDWMKRWSGSVRVADYSSGGWEHLWYVEGSAQALAEIREEHRCGGTWLDGTPLD